jgi:hypothetical protein
MNKTLLFLSSLFFVIGCSLVHADPSQQKEPTTFDECVAGGGKILRTFPGQCVSPSGARFVDPSQAAAYPKEGKGIADSVKSLCVNHCGDGTCQEMVCMGEGCPCAETTANCPTDCSAS